MANISHGDFLITFDMDFSNKGGVKRLRIILLVIGICWLLAMAFFIFMEMFTALAILAGSFLVVALMITLLNFQFVRITLANNKLIVRYYSIFSVDRLFQMFEFPVEVLRDVEVRKYFFGLKWKMRFTVRVKKGLADYPWVSLSAVSFRERSKLVRELRKLIPQK